MSAQAQLAPSFTLNQVIGHSVSPGDDRGRAIVLIFGNGSIRGDGAGMRGGERILSLSR